jgi:hypothetical protein
LTGPEKKSIIAAIFTSMLLGKEVTSWDDTKKSNESGKSNADVTGS